MSSQVINRSALIEKTVFLRTNFKVMGVSKKVSNTVLSNGTVLSTDVKAKLLRVQKTLLESKELDAIKSADGAMRNWLYNICLPYDMGILLLSRELLDTVTDRLDAFTDERAGLVRTFVDAYPQLCIDARGQLENLASELHLSVELLYNPADYPSVDRVAALFGFEYQYFSFSIPDGLREEIRETETAKAQAKIEMAIEGITSALRESFLELVDHLKSALEPTADGKKKRLYATTVTNLQDFLDTFKARNVTNDAQLDALVAEVQSIIKPGVSSDILKKDESFASDVHRRMSDVSADLTKLVEVIPGRKFRTE